MKFSIFGLGFGLFVTSIYASSHSEAPDTQKAPAAHDTDWYAFVLYETGRSGFSSP